MTTTEELYEQLPDAFKEIFTKKKNQDDNTKEREKTSFEILQETLEKIKSNYKR